MLAAGSRTTPPSRTPAETDKGQPKPEKPAGEVSQRYERGSILATSNLPFDEWTEAFDSERLTGALLERLTHHVYILEKNGESYRLRQSRKRRSNKQA